MQYFKITAICGDADWVEGNNNRADFLKRKQSINQLSYDYNIKYTLDLFLFISDILDERVTLGVITDAVFDVEFEARKFLRYLKIKAEDIRKEEIVFERLRHLINSAERNDYIYDGEEVFERFSLGVIYHRGLRHIGFDEKILPGSTKEKNYAAAEKLLVKSKMQEELDRIYECKVQKNILGHPVHYVVMTDDGETMDCMTEILMMALYENNRIHNKRYGEISVVAHLRNSYNEINCLYRSCIGGTVVIRFLDNDDYEDDRASVNRELIEELSFIVKKYMNRVLTIFCMGRECTKKKEIIYEYLPGLTMVEIDEEYVYNDEAKNYLAVMAKDMHVRTNKKLFAKIVENKGYLADELKSIFDTWYNRKLREQYYLPYNNIKAIGSRIKESKPKGSAYKELMEMPGLTDAKKIINEVIDYYKAQKLFAEKGMKQDIMSMHMIFTGNPGTAKTTCARLFAEIMKDNHVLSKGKLIEVGRGDLVGRFVGWTAPTVIKKFKEAEGSVLFIDEAYSLVDDRDGCYGDEAINAIVQEMENHRGDVVVIFAGYPDKMEGFLDKNPGLRSRIAFHVPFNDYTPSELCDISGIIAQKKGINISDDAMEKLEKLYESSAAMKDFGNGRFVRNVIEKAKLAQARRLIKMDYDSVNSKDVETILPEDIEMPAFKCKDAHIGFAV